MGSTPLFNLHWPELTDAPNGPAQFRQLAEDTEPWLCSAFPCTNSTRPTVAQGVTEGFLIDVTDTGTTEIWRNGAWTVVAGPIAAGGGGGGGGGTPAIGTVSATYAATSAQSIPISTDTTLAFGVQLVSDPAVTRSTSGSGHQFTLGQTRLWIITATLRFSQNATGGRTFELRSGSTVLAKASGPINADGPFTACLAVARKLNAGTSITAIGRHNATTSLALEPAGGDYVHIDIAGV